MPTVLDHQQVEMVRAFRDPYAFFQRYFRDRMMSGHSHITNAPWQIDGMRTMGKAAKSVDANGAPASGRIALSWPRQFGKTTFGRAFMLWTILCGYRRYSLVFRTNAQVASSELADYIRILSDPTSLIVRDFGLQNWVSDIQKRRGLSWSTEKLHIPNIAGEIACMQALGAGANPRGLENSGIRPDMIKLDDVEGTEGVLSKATRNSMERWLTHDIEPLGSESLIIFTQTTVSPRSLISQAHTNGLWQSYRMPALDEDGNSTWPQRYSSEYLHSLRGKMPPSAWLADYQNMPQANELTLFPTDSWRIYEEEGDEARKVFTRVCIGVDLAFSQSQTADYTAITSWGEAPDESKHHIATIRGRWSNPQEVIAKIGMVDKLQRADKICIEDVASSKHFIEMARRELGSRVIGIGTGGLDKTARARMIMSDWELRRVWRKKADTDIVQHMYDFRPDVRDQEDDVLDAVVYAIMGMKRGSAQVWR